MNYNCDCAPGVKPDDKPNGKEDSKEESSQPQICEISTDILVDQETDYDPNAPLDSKI